MSASNAVHANAYMSAGCGVFDSTKPSTSGAQYSRLQKVSMSALLPGDLIFWGPGGSDHVAIYIGGGKIISAPYTGAVVRIQGIWGSPVGAARP